MSSFRFGTLVILLYSSNTNDRWESRSISVYRDPSICERTLSFDSNVRLTASRRINITRLRRREGTASILYISIGHLKNRDGAASWQITDRR